MKSLANFYWLGTNLCQNCIRNSQNLLIVLADQNLKIQKFRETRNLKHLYRNELDNACFPHDAVYFDSKDLAKRTISDKVLKGRTYEISRNCNYDGYQSALAGMIYKCFNKKDKIRSKCKWTTSWRIT